LRETARRVRGVGAKQPTSDWLIADWDGLIFYDGLVRVAAWRARSGGTAGPRPAAKLAGGAHHPRKEAPQALKNTAVQIVVDTFEALLAERGDSGKIWASALKQAITRRKPDFSESYYGFRAFGNLLEEAQARDLLSLGRDDKSGAYVSRKEAEAPPKRPRKARTSRTASAAQSAAATQQAQPHPAQPQQA